MSYLPVLLVVTQWDYLSGKPTSRASCNIWDETHLGAMPYLPSYNITIYYLFMAGLTDLKGLF